MHMKYLHTMIRVTDPEATVRFFELLGLRKCGGWRARRGGSR
jgi:lactoylglutathione lyase